MSKEPELLYGIKVTSSGGWYISGNIYSSLPLAKDYASERYSNSSDKIEIVELRPICVVESRYKGSRK